MKDSAVLLIDCPDRKGLVARVSTLLYERGANILHADQHQDHELGLFFMRVEWALAEGGTSSQGFDMEAFKVEFAPLARELGMRWKLTLGDRRPRMALFCSQYLHCMADLLYRWRSGELECEIPLIVSNHPRWKRWPPFTAFPSSTFQ
jgi:formyltetrahydrofolate deformylase